ncbi:unnamed protein product [Strongylus vulgaris]|uniref:Uncharacterized protein n=1 Tax=Strongylus vulgaris TaxID=40348 RepID=A0A3P7JBE3_STRVU|nr:unnamed protein product [Strongylus vulgaris]
MKNYVFSEGSLQANKIAWNFMRNIVSELALICFQTFFLGQFMILLFAILLCVDALHILQLADFHLDVDYSINGDNLKMCHGNDTTGAKLGSYGDYMCDAPIVSKLLVGKQ